MSETTHARPKAPAAQCFVTGCRKPGTQTTEASMPGGVKVDVHVCDEHMASLVEAQQEASGKGAGVCHVCNMPVGVVNERLVTTTNVSRQDTVVVSWWVHSDDGSFCHETCGCIKREEGKFGYKRASATVTIR